MKPELKDKKPLPPLNEKPSFRFSGGKPPKDFKIPMADISGIKRKFLDIPYAHESPNELIDIYLPDEGDGPFPLLIQIHGGGFAIGDKRDGHVQKLLDSLKKGYAFASIQYRLSGEAVFPAAVLDCRMAIRFLKEHAEEYKIDPWRIATIGGSAGGNLSALLAMNIPNNEFIGEEGQKYLYNPFIKTAIDWFGPTDFKKMDDEAAHNGVSFTDHFEPYSAESGYMGKPLNDVDPSFAAKANPMSYITKEMAPLLIEHGTVDKLVPFQQSQILYEAIENKLGGGYAEFVPLEGADHEDKMFESDTNMDIVWDWLKEHL
jgi:acetyl esterase/lipase